MYKVYSDTTCIHDSKSPDKTAHLVDPVLKLGDNIAGSFSCTIPSSNVGYNVVSRLTSTIKIYRDDKLIWTGRVINETYDFYGRRKVSCEGALAFLNDTIQPLTTYNNTTLVNFLRTLLDNHNAKVPASRRINIGAVTVNDMNDSHVYTTNYDNTWTTFQKEIFNRLGGHIRIRYANNDEIPRLDYLEDYPKTATQEINFGNNLLDFTKNWDLSNLVTVILPRGAQLEDEDEWGNKDYVTVASVNNGDKYVKNVTGFNTYGWISEVIDFDDVESPAVLLQLANAYLSALQFDEMQLDISAFDLHHLNSSISSFDLLDEVRCISKPHGMDTMFPVIGMNIPLDKPDSVSYTMGKVSDSLSTKNHAINQNIISKMMNFPSFENLLDQAKQQATEILNMATTGYVNIIQENEQSQALVITNTPDIENATKLWRFNMNGLGYSKNGGVTYDLAITMDGTIVADFIKTGILSDGYGLNWWNLSTGEFQLAYNTEFVNSVGDGITISDIASVASDASDDADYAQTLAILAGDNAAAATAIANVANNKQVGGDNLLKGVGSALAISSGNSNWANGTWDGNSGSSATKKVVSITDAPNSYITKGFYITSNNNGSSSSDVVQRSVKLAPNQTYTISCYAKGDPSIKIAFKIGKTVSNSPMYAFASTNLSSSWLRYSYTFKTGANNTYSTEAKTAGIVNNLTDVFFGIIATSGKSAYICGMKLERGNVSTDWSEPSNDTKTVSVNESNAYTDKAKAASINYTDQAKTASINYTNQAKTASINYTDQAKASANAYTDKSVKKTAEDLAKKVNQAYKDATQFTDQAKTYIKNYFTDTEIFNRLTNKGARKGLYLSGGQLYINATYIKSGSLDANLVRTGVIIDRKGYSAWDLTQGTLRTNYMIANNITATGTLTAGTYYRMIMSGGEIYGYRDTNTFVGKISPVSSLIDLDTGRLYHGLEIVGGALDIRTNVLSVLNSQSESEIGHLGWTGKVEFWAVDDSFAWAYTHGIQCCNGIVMCAW